MANVDVGAEINKARASGLLPQGYRIMILSPSQLETFAGTKESCERKWWFKNGLDKKVRLPEVERQATGFGQVLHEVVERYLNADDTGRDRTTGEAVDLYPPGWEQAKPDYKGRVPRRLELDEQRLIKVLVSKAIEAGYLVREPGRKVERPFWRHLGLYEPEDVCENCGACAEWHSEGACVDGGYWKQVPGYSIFVMGSIDLETPGKITDHKTTKNMRYATSKKDLQKDPAMLIYAYDMLDSLTEEAPLTHVDLEHLVYCKDPEDTRVRRTKVTVPVERVESYWKRVGTQLRDMVRRKYHQDVSQWKSIPGADESPRSNACNAYGGCPFLTICCGRETVAMYRHRVDKVNLRQQVAAKKGAAMPPKMSLKDALKNKKKNAPPAAKPAANPPVPSKSAKAPATSGSKKSRGEALSILTGGKKTDASKITTKESPIKKSAKKDKSAKKSAAAPTKAKAKKVPRTRDDGTLIVAPWAVESCNGCKVEHNGEKISTGISSKGAPCRPCANLRSKDNEVNPDWFELDTDDKGRLLWTPRDEYAGMFETGGTEEIEAGATETELPAEPDPEEYEGFPDDHDAWETWKKDHDAWEDLGGDPEWDWDEPEEVEEEPAQEEEVEEEPAQEEAYEPETEVRAETAGLRLFVGCLRMKPYPFGVTLFEDVCVKYGSMLAEKTEADSFYDLDPFKRRDLLAQFAGQIAEDLGDATVMAPLTVSPDFQPLLEKFKVLASELVISL